VQQLQEELIMTATTAMSRGPTLTNGVDVTALGQTMDAINADPGLAAFRFRTANTWMDGGHNRSIIGGFYGCRSEDETRAEPFVLEADEPPVLLGEDQGANPVEYLLHALAACMTTSMVYHAAARGIAIESLSSQLEGDLDLRGFLGLSGDVRKGYQAIRARFEVQSDADPETLKTLVEFSPVYDVVSRSVPVTIQINGR
jgi:uncharacterized OsmC-like protein